MHIHAALRLLVPALLLLLAACAPAATPAPTTAAIGGATATPSSATATVPATWQTGTLPGVTFRFPPDWRLQTNPDGVLVLVAPNEDQRGNGSMVVQLYPETLAAFLASDNPSTGEKQDKQYPRIADTTIAGRPARVTYGGCCGGNGKYVFVESNAGRTLSLGLYGERAAAGQMRNESIFDQIISSVRFN